MVLISDVILYIFAVIGLLTLCLLAYVYTLEPLYRKIKQTIKLKLRKIETEKAHKIIESLEVKVGQSVDYESNGALWDITSVDSSFVNPLENINICMYLRRPNGWGSYKSIPLKTFESDYKKDPKTLTPLWESINGDKTIWIKK